MKTAAIYARRSKVVETGDSIETQIQLCTNYLKNIGITNTLVYSDEGFSGKDTDRPNFIKLMEDAKKNKFQILICYKLDRLSRNIGDFSNLINDLERYNISFISVVEQFDTGSAMGKAMMYICSVFSQLERETISKRVCDNMYALAENGYWLGGECPCGYTSKRNVIIDASGKNRSYAELIPVETEIQVVKLLFNKYLELGSLSKVEKYTLQNNIKTRRGKDWSKTTIKNILTNPVYVKADNNVVDYFKSLGITTYGVVNNLNGILIYKKRKGKNGTLRNPSEWIYAVSNHEGIIESSTWLQIQKMTEINKLRAPNIGCSNTALLSGMIRCAKCGTFMRVCYGQPSKSTGKRKYYYACTMKHNSGKVRCSNRNADGPELDRLIINKLKELSLDKNILIKRLKEYKNSLVDSSENYIYKNLKDSISQNKEQTANILNTLSLTTDENVVKMLLDKLSNLKDEEIKLTESLSNLTHELEKQNSLINNCDSLISKLKNFSSLIDSLDIKGQKQLVASVIDRVFVNGDTGAVKIKFKTFDN